MIEPHAITRARQRYGLELTVADLDTIRANIATGNSVLTRRDRRGEVHIVQIQGATILAVVNRDNDYVCTVLALGGYRRACQEDGSWAGR